MQAKQATHFFHQLRKREDIPFLLPKSKINNSEIERSECLRHLGVLPDEKLSCKIHIKYIKSEIVENILLSHKAKPYIDKHSILSLYHSYIHTYINYGNTAWKVQSGQTFKK